MSKTIRSKEYNEWLNSPLTKALKRSFEQSITDPENQPSQYGTVTLAMYEHLKEQITSSQQRVAELEKERDGLISKNQNLFNALMVSTHKKDSMYASIKAASGHLNLYGLFSCVEGDSYDPECADKNVRKANSILRTELTTEINLGDLVRLRDEQIAKLTAERDKATQYWQIAEGRCDALMKQRDELVAALEPFVKHNSSKSVIDLAIRTSDIAKARAAIASVKEKQNAAD